MILILNEELPADLRDALERDAREHDITLNDAALAILGQHYKVRYEGSDAGYRELAVRFKLRVPDRLHRAIRLDASRRGGTVRGVVLNILSQHYGLEAIDPHRRPRRATA